MAYGGTSTTASAEKGKKVFEAVVDELVKHVNKLKEEKLSLDVKFKS